MAFRIPESALGTKAEDVNRATASAEIDLKDEDTIPYLLKKIERMINRYLVHSSLGKSYRFEFTPGVTEEKKSSISERVRAEVGAGIITPNEARKQLGYDEMEGLDEIIDDTDPEPEPAMFSEDVGKQIKDEPLRETESWHEFPFQPSDVEEFAEALQYPLQEFYEELFKDDDFIKAIEDWLTNQDDDDLKKWIDGDIDKSIMTLGE